MFSQVTSQRACFEWSEASCRDSLPAVTNSSPAAMAIFFLNIFSSWKPPKRIIGHCLSLTAYHLFDADWFGGFFNILQPSLSETADLLLLSEVNRRTRYGVCVRNSSLTLSTRKRSPLTGMRRYCSSSRSGVRKPKPRAFTRKRSGEFRNSFRSSAAGNRPSPGITAQSRSLRFASAAPRELMYHHEPCTTWHNTATGLVEAMQDRNFSPDKTASPARCYRITAAPAALRKAASQPGLSHNNGCGGRRMRQDHSDR